MVSDSASPWPSYPESAPSATQVSELDKESYARGGPVALVGSVVTCCGAARAEDGAAQSWAAKAAFL